MDQEHRSSPPDHHDEQIREFTDRMAYLFAKIWIRQQGQVTTPKEDGPVVKK